MTKELSEENIHSAMPLIERMKSVIIDVIDELDPPPKDKIIVTKNGIAMMNVETFHELTNGQYRNAVGMPGLKWTKDGPVRKEEKE